MFGLFWHSYNAVICRMSNIVLTQTDGKIVSCGRQISTKMSKERPLQTGLKYSLPPVQKGTIPLPTIPYEDFKRGLQNTFESLDDRGNGFTLVTLLVKSFKVTSFWFSYTYINSLFAPRSCKVYRFLNDGFLRFQSDFCIFFIMYNKSLQLWDNLLKWGRFLCGKILWVADTLLTPSYLEHVLYWGNLVIAYKFLQIIFDIVSHNYALHVGSIDGNLLVPKKLVFVPEVKWALEILRKMCIQFPEIWQKACSYLFNFMMTSKSLFAWNLLHISCFSNLL